MNDNTEKQLPPENDPDAEGGANALPLPDDAFDVDAALAALAELPALTQEDTLEESDEGAEEDGIAREESLAHEEAPHASEVAFMLPPMSELMRGQVASFLPAFVLIVVGAGLTFALAGGGIVLTPVSVLILISMTLGIVLLAQWFSSGRWSLGNLFVGALLFLWGAVGAVLTSNDTLTLYNGYPLFIASLGVVIIVTALFGDATRQPVLLVGTGVLAGGLLALANTLGALPLDLYDTLSSFALPVLIVVAFIAMLPRLARGRGQA